MNCIGVHSLRVRRLRSLHAVDLRPNGNQGTSGSMHQLSRDEEVGITSRRRHTGCRARQRSVSALVVAAMLCAGPLNAQQQKPCHSICAPSLTLQPAAIISHVIDRPRVKDLTTNKITLLPKTTNLIIQLVLAAPTAIPRTSLLASFQWLPTAATASNPFTEYTASELGTTVHDNEPSITLGALIALLKPAETMGGFGANGYVADNFGPAQKSSDANAYTHKLDVGLSALVNVFNWLPDGTWLRHAQAVVTLDYIATGLPKAGEDVPKGERVFLTDARPAKLILGLSLPVAPLNPKQ